MKSIRYMVAAGLAVVVLSSTGVLRAQTNPPVVVGHGDRDLARDLRGVPDNIKQLIVRFDHIRDKYLADQKALLIQAKNATTQEERDQFRQQLQDNRQKFMEMLQTFRQSLKDDLQALVGKISHEEFLRVIDAAHDAATEGGLHHHRGHR